VIGLRANDDAHRWCPRHDFLTLRLRYAACHRDQRHSPLFTAVLHDAADVGIDLLGRLLADVARVEHDKIRRRAIGRRAHAFGGEQLGHALAVIDVHLAAEALDVKGAGRRRG
jgi:hypothetical protein